MTYPPVNKVSLITLYHLLLIVSNESPIRVKPMTFQSTFLALYHKAMRDSFARGFLESGTHL